MLKQIDRRSLLDVLIFGVVFAGLGTIFGVMISAYQEPAHSLIDPTRYNDFGLYIGAVVGLLTGAAAFLTQGVVTRRILHRTWFSLQLFLVFCGTAGLAAGLVTYVVLVSSAPAFDMKARAVSLVLLDGVVTGVLGGVFGLILGVIFAKVRDLEKR